MASPSYGAPMKSPTYLPTPSEFAFQTVPAIMTDLEMISTMAADNLVLSLTERINLLSKLQQSYTFSTNHNNALQTKLTHMRKRVKDTISPTLYQRHFRLTDSFCECMYKLSSNAGGVMSGPNMTDQQFESFLSVKQNIDENVQSVIQRLELLASRCTITVDGETQHLISKNICRSRLTSGDFCQPYLQSEVLKGKLANEEFNIFVTRLIDADSLLRPIHLAKTKHSSFSHGKPSPSVPSTPGTIIAAAKTTPGGTTTPISQKQANGCQHCISQGGTGQFANFAGHHEDTCFKLHPELKKAFEERRQSRTAHLASSTPSHHNTSIDTDDDEDEDDITANIRAVWNRNSTHTALPLRRSVNSCRSRPAPCDNDECPELISNSSSDSDVALTMHPPVGSLHSSTGVMLTTVGSLSLSSPNVLSPTVGALDSSTATQMSPTVGVMVSSTNHLSLVNPTNGSYAVSNGTAINDRAISVLPPSSCPTITLDPEDTVNVPEGYVNPFVYGDDLLHREFVLRGYPPIDSDSEPSIPFSVQLGYDPPSSFPITEGLDINIDSHTANNTLLPPVSNTSNNSAVPITFRHLSHGVPYSSTRPSYSSTLYSPNLRLHMLRLVAHMLTATLSRTMSPHTRMYNLLRHWRVFGIRFLGQENDIDPIICTSVARLYQINPDPILVHLLRLQTLILHAFENDAAITDDDFIQQVFNLWQRLGCAVHSIPRN